MTNNLMLRLCVEVYSFGGDRMCIQECLILRWSLCMLCRTWRSIEVQFQWSVREVPHGIVLNIPTFVHEQ